MSKKEKDITFFVAFCIEEYRAAKGLSGEEVIELFAKYDVTDYLSKCFEPLHTQGRQWLIDEIDEFIDIRKNKKAWIYQRRHANPRTKDIQIGRPISLPHREGTNNLTFRRIKKNNFVICFR